MSLLVPKTVSSPTTSGCWTAGLPSLRRWGWRFSKDFSASQISLCDESGYNLPAEVVFQLSKQGWYMCARPTPSQKTFTHLVRRHNFLAKQFQTPSRIKQYYTHSLWAGRKWTSLARKIFGALSWNTPDQLSTQVQLLAMWIHSESTIFSFNKIIIPLQWWYLRRSGGLSSWCTHHDELTGNKNQQH